MKFLNAVLVIGLVLLSAISFAADSKQCGEIKSSGGGGLGSDVSYRLDVVGKDNPTLFSRNAQRAIEEKIRANVLVEGNGECFEITGELDRTGEYEEFKTVTSTIKCACG